MNVQHTCLLKVADKGTNIAVFCIVQTWILLSKQALSHLRHKLLSTVIALLLFLTQTISACFLLRSTNGGSREKSSRAPFNSIMCALCRRRSRDDVKWGNQRLQANSTTCYVCYATFMRKRKKMNGRFYYSCMKIHSNQSSGAAASIHIPCQPLF